MKVLHFYRTYKTDSFGGIEQLIWHLCKGSASIGIIPTVLSLSRTPSTVYLDGHRVCRVKRDLQVRSMSISLAAFPRFAELAQEADVIHYHFPWPFMDLVHFASRTGKPSVVTYHSDIIRQKLLLPIYRPLMKAFLASVNRIVATSPNYLATSDVLSRYSDKVKIIPIGIDRSAYLTPTPERLAYWRRMLGGRFFLFVGMLRYYKGLHILLEAIKGAPYSVAIVGAGPIEAELVQQSRRLGLNNVVFLGALPEEDKIALLELCYGVVFPSHLRSEAFGVTLLEGAMYGKPLVSSEIGTGTSYINIDGETGLVVPPGDPGAFRGAMDYLWEHTDEARRMGERAAVRYEHFFTGTRMVSAYAALYTELLDKTGEQAIGS